jgi:hypothetical protein
VTLHIFSVICHLGIAVISWYIKLLITITNVRMICLIKYIIIIIMALQPFVGPWPLSQFLDPIHSR